jgi:glycosyltransferase involved in cell wall biosynthesis
MRILIVSNLYPPIASGGYEAGCASVVGYLRDQEHDVRVLASSFEHESAPIESEVERTLSLLTPDARGAWRAPLASLRAVAVARRAIEWKPDLVYVWNGASIPQAALRVLADSGSPLAFRIEEHWFARIFLGDQFLRELLPHHRGPARSAWSLGCRLLNTLPALRLDPTARLRTAITWNSEAIRRMAPPPPFVETVLERVIHPAPPNGNLYASIERKPGPEPRIVFLGRVTPYKGIAVAIQALALLQSELGTPVSLDIVGPEDGDHGEELRRLAEGLGVGTAVRWHGQTDPTEAAAVLSRAHALIVPSTWDEPFPYVTIEGALARVPLVATDVGGIGEGMHDEEHALLFPRGDAAAAATALARTLRETDQTAARVQRAYERAQSFRLGPYLEEQERFVLDAVDIQRAAAGSRP